ncbi:MAG: hypothetical protein CL623_12255 [Arcobacter sp.]|nr:hypothetical protein [Arcobacter sp.]|tara:strand:- start:4638 stop:5606 length:969 start_codon:yes stop_codon:yes gene_type:complete
MNRTEYYNYIDEKLTVLAQRIINNGKLNILHLHMHSENFYLHFFNLLYGYELENLNQSLQNVEAIDLIDHTNRIVIQVSSTNTKQKIESALEKDIIKQYPNYTFKFISIAKDATSLRTKSYKNPHSISFTPSSDIYDTLSILNEISSLNIDKQKEIYQFIRKELGNEIDVVKLDSNLATIINILAKEDWDESNQYDEVNSFEIERKITHNNLSSAKSLIDEYSLYYGKVNSKYTEFDNMGNNKSNSVLAAIKREYLKLKNSSTDDEVFFATASAILNKISESANYIQIPIDELELCIDILIVDAFIRCKIFENPMDYNYATT